MADELVSQREIVELIAAVRALTAEVREQNDAYRKLAEDIYGNGKPGLKAEVKELRDRLNLAYAALATFAVPVVLYMVVNGFQYLTDLITHYGKPPTP